MLFLVLLVAELTDVMFAADSVPAILGLSKSSIMVILGLRALYFLLTGMMGRFRRLDWALAAVLVLVGAKMLAHDFFHVPNWASLLVIGGLLGRGIAASLLLPRSPDEYTPP
jgi:tellurite resistance protein TerC